jgi:hypothetical protein
VFDKKANLVKVRGTELLASDTLERYREKLARIADIVPSSYALSDVFGVSPEVSRGTERAICDRIALTLKRRADGGIYRSKPCQPQPI